MTTADRATRRRYNFRFSLRTWLAVVVGFSCWLGWWSQSALRQKKAIEGLPLGVWVRYDFEYHPHQTMPVDSPVPRRLLDWFGVDYFHNVVEIRVYLSWPDGWDDEDFVEQLPELSLDGLLRLLEVVPHLRSLDVWQSDVSEVELAAICRLDKLEQLTIRDASLLTDRSAVYLTRLRRLRDLSLTGARFTDEGVRLISELPELDDLGLFDTTITDRGLEHLGRMTQLRFLYLSGSPAITVDGLKELRNLQKLVVLSLHRTPISEQGFEQLASLKRLRILNLTEVGTDDWVRLQTLLPDCRVNLLPLEQATP